MDPLDTVALDGGDVNEPLKSIERFCPAVPGGRFPDVGVFALKMPGMNFGPPITPLVPFM